jgi:hypothetical protein
MYPLYAAVIKEVLMPPYIAVFEKVSPRERGV